MAINNKDYFSMKAVSNCSLCQEVPHFAASSGIDWRTVPPTVTAGMPQKGGNEGERHVCLSLWKSWGHQNLSISAFLNDRLVAYVGIEMVNGWHLYPASSTGCSVVFA